MDDVVEVVKGGLWRGDAPMVGSQSRQQSQPKAPPLSTFAVAQGGFSVRHESRRAMSIAFAICSSSGRQTLRVPMSRVDFPHPSRCIG